MHGEIDLTAGHSLSLSKETKDVLGHVHREVKITAFLLRADSSRVQAASLLARYRRRNHYVAYRVVDATGLVHALLLRIQALLLPIKTLVLSGH